MVLDWEASGLGRDGDYPGRLCAQNRKCFKRLNQIISRDADTRPGLLRLESPPRYDSDCNRRDSLPNTVGARPECDRSESRSLRHTNRRCRMLRRPWLFGGIGLWPVDMQITGQRPMPPTGSPTWKLCESDQGTRLDNRSCHHRSIHWPFPESSQALKLRRAPIREAAFQNRQHSPRNGNLPKHW